MAIKNWNLDPEKLKSKLLYKGSYGRVMLSIVDFISNECVQDIIGEINSRFNSNYGNKAYNRGMLLCIFLYCHHCHVRNVVEIERMVKYDEIIRIVTDNADISRSTLERFQKETQSIAFRKIFLYTLLEANEYGLLKFLKAFIDGTDGIVNASKNYTLNEKELKGLKLLKKWNITHNNKNKSIKQFLIKLENKAQEFNEDSDEFLSIALILKNPYKFHMEMIKRIDELEKAIGESKNNYVSINFPDAVMMKTKKGKFDFGFNIQTIMTEHKLIISSIVSKEANDHYVAQETITDLIFNFKILLDLIKQYGERKNYKEIERMLSKAIYIFDSGYWTEKNIEDMAKMELKTLIMSKQLSRQINNELRKKQDIKMKIGFKSNKDKITKKDFKRIKNGYSCPMNKKLKLIEVKDIKKQNGSHTNHKNYRHTCFECSSCSLKEECAGEHDFKVINDRMSPAAYEMTNKLLNKRYQDIYAERFHSSEGINGYYKNTTGAIHLLGSDKESVQNGLYLINTMYNITRIRNLKGTAY